MNWQRLNTTLYHLVPYIDYRRAMKKLCLKIDNVEALAKDEFNVYAKCSVSKLKEALMNEHDRASHLEQKTHQLILVVSFAFAVLGLGGIALIETIETLTWQIIAGFFATLSVIYLLGAAIYITQSLQAVRTFGIGIGLEVTLAPLNPFEQARCLAELLVQQEASNLIRSNRNAVVYVCVRNGLFCLLAAILVSVFTLLVEAVLGACS